MRLRDRRESQALKCLMAKGRVTAPELGKAATEGESSVSRPRDASWLGFKIALLGLSIALGLVIRLQLRPFGPLLGKVVAGTASAADEAALQRLIAHVKVPVWVIWIALVIAAVLGSTHWSP